jgi:hypothetical protein
MKGIQGSCTIREVESISSHEIGKPMTSSKLSQLLEGNGMVDET